MTSKQPKQAIDMAQLAARIEHLEAEKRVRQCMNQYMAFCDDLNDKSDLSLLISLFTDGAVWRGIGSRYAKTYGEYKGKTKIRAMFARYTKTPAHFLFNAHFLCNELIEVTDKTATGSWMLIQPSTFNTGESRLSCARISAEFKFVKDSWKISLFTTENLFSRPMQAPWDSNTALDVPD